MNPSANFTTVQCMGVHYGREYCSIPCNGRNILPRPVGYERELRRRQAMEDTEAMTSHEDPHARPPPPSNQASNPITDEQIDHNVQLLTHLRTIESKHQKENKSEGEAEGEGEGEGEGKGQVKAKGKGKGKGKGRDDSREVAADYTPKMTPMALARATALRNSASTPSPSSSFVASDRTYADVLSPGRPSSAIRRRPNSGSLPQDE